MVTRSWGGDPTSGDGARAGLRAKAEAHGREPPESRQHPRKAAPPESRQHPLSLHTIFCGHAGPSVPRRFSPAAGNRGCSPAVVRGVLTAAASVPKHSLAGAQAQQLPPRAPHLPLPSSGAQAQQLGLSGLAALWPVGPSQVRGQARAPCMGRQTLHTAPPGKPNSHLQKRTVSIACKANFNCSPKN